MIDTLFSPTLKPEEPLFFLYKGAYRFAYLHAGAAQQVVGILPKAAANISVGATSSCVEIIRHIPTPHADLWVGAFAEQQGLTIVSLEFEDPGEALLRRMRALARARQRPIIGGFSLDERPINMQESLRVLLDEHRRLPGNRAAEFDSMTDSASSIDAETARYSRGTLARQLIHGARRWRTTQARRDFKHLLQEALTAPQLVEKDGQQVLIIDRDLLERLAQPLSGASLAARFSGNHLPTLKFVIEPPEDPEPKIRIDTHL